MAINPLPTVDYSIDVQTPFQASVEGLKFAAGREALDATRMQRQREEQSLLAAQQQQQQFQSGINSFFQQAPADRKFDDLSRLMIGANKQQFDALKNIGDTMTTERKEQSQKFAAQSLLALDANPEMFQTMISERVAIEPDPNQKRAFETVQQIAKTDPKRAGILLEELGAATFGKTWYDSITAARGERRTAALAPSVLSEQVAKSELAVQQAENAVATAVDDVAKARAQRQFEESKARLEALKEKFAEQEGKDAITKRLADLNLTKAQTNKYQVETRNLTDTGKMLRLDYEAALKGVPLPSKNAGATVGDATEDERKAAGWLAQASNAYSNMLSAMYTKDKQRTGAEEVTLAEKALGGIARGPERQKFVQAASSLSEALLRAATGAGVNENEAKQKLEELTPLLTDGDAVIKQKIAAIPVYLDSLKARAGRAAPQGFQIPTVESTIQRKNLTITLPDGKEYTAPDQATLDEFKRRSKL